MKYFIVDSNNIKQPHAPFLYLDEVNIGDIFESKGYSNLEDGMYVVKEMKVINDYTVECIVDKK